MGEMIGPYELNSIVAGECAGLMANLPDNSVDMWLTSPPYDNLRTYNDYTFDFPSIARQLYRVTKPGGVGVWVVADQTINGSETGTSFRQALYFMGLGFNLWDTMIYQKDALQFPDDKRYQPCFEYMFLFSKGTPKTINLITDRKNVSFGRKVTGNNRQSNGETRQASCYGQDIKEFGVRWNVWQLSNSKGNEVSGHPAPFPEALARDHILSWSNPGDLVFDPMVGSGTTAKMAYLTGRKFLGFEISQEYVDIARRRLEAVKSQPFLPGVIEAQPQPTQLYLMSEG